MAPSSGESQQWQAVPKKIGGKNSKKMLALTIYHK
jgi:hypothetical protein